MTTEMRMAVDILFAIYLLFTAVYKIIYAKLLLLRQIYKQLWLKQVFRVLADIAAEAIRTIAETEATSMMEPPTVK